MICFQKLSRLFYFVYRENFRIKNISIHLFINCRLKRVVLIFKTSFICYKTFFYTLIFLFSNMLSIISLYILFHKNTLSTDLFGKEGCIYSLSSCEPFPAILSRSFSPAFFTFDFALSAVCCNFCFLSFSSFSFFSFSSFSFCDMY